MSEIDRTIEGVEQLYRSVTGHAPTSQPGLAHEAIPPEVDPTRWVEEQMGRLMSLLALTQESESVVPPLALWETVDSYVALLDLAGVQRESLKVSVVGQGVLVEGTRLSLADVVPEGALLRYREQRLGPCRRIVGLPPDARLDLLEAKLSEGVLLLRVPRVTEPRAVAVQ